MRKKRAVSYYDRPTHYRVGRNILDGLLSAAALYFLQPLLLSKIKSTSDTLAPVQQPENQPGTPNPQGTT